jgi:hypothetical protein
MSREFGYSPCGFFHDKVRYAGEDLKTAEGTLARRWGKFFEAFYPIAYDISNFEAGDSGEYAPIMTTIEQMDKIKKVIEDIEIYLEPFQAVAERAIEKHIESKKEK